MYVRLQPAHVLLVEMQTCCWELQLTDLKEIIKWGCFRSYREAIEREVCLLSLQLTEASMFINSRRSNDGQCRQDGGTFNPFNMTLMVRLLTSPPQLISNSSKHQASFLAFGPQSSACSLESPLSCAVGEISARQGASSLAERRVYTDSSIDLSGDFTGNTFR